MTHAQNKGDVTLPGDTSQNTVVARLSRLDAARPEAPARLGRYDVIGRLGRGGMGTVYDALDRGRGTRVALKTLSIDDPSAAVRLKREFRLVADLAHPSLAPVYELAEVDGLWFFSMQRVDGVSFTHWARHERVTLEATQQLAMSRMLETTLGENLSTKLGVPSSLPPVDMPALSAPRRSLSEIRRALLDLVGAISALHDVGLFHGDLKPANVLVREDGRVMVVDFGLSGHVGEGIPVSGSIAGTPLYMPPEQLSGEAASDAASDWYALGVLLYRVLTGRLPFAGNSMLDLLFKKRHHVPRPPSVLPQVPVDLSDLCMALIDPFPDERPTVQEILETLGGEGKPATSSPRRPGAWRRRHVYFVGREHELAELERAYGSARGGRMVVVHTHGPSGIGKSALLHSFLRGVQDLDGALVLRGRCYERENVPYKAFDRVVDEIANHLCSLGAEQVRERLPRWSVELSTVFPALTAVDALAKLAEQPALPRDAMELRRRAWAALSDLLAALRRDRPIVLEIDDLQWVDADSAQLLTELISATHAPPLLLVMGFRPEAADNPLLEQYFARCARLAADDALLDLPIDALPVAEAELLARAALERDGVAAEDDRVRYVARESAGVPFFIEELAHFIATGSDGLGDGVSFGQAILARVANLPSAQRALMEVVAVAGSPLPQSLVFEAADIDADDLPALLALRSASLVSWLGAGADDRVSPYHDRIRESVVIALDEPAKKGVHLALGRALARRHERDPSGPWVFEAARHLGTAATLIKDPDECLAVAALFREAGRRARRAAAFPLSFGCFEGGIALLPDDAWEAHYPLSLALHVGAAEAAYLCAAWDALDARVRDVKAHARSAMDQMLAWQVQIDAHIGKKAYGAAVDTGVEALQQLGVTLPANPSEAEVGAAVQDALERLTAIGPDAFEALGEATDPEVLAAMRIQARLSPGAYFSRPGLLPVMASNLIKTSIEKGLSSATPFALALFGIVLNTLEMFPVSYTWGQLALRLMDRYPDRSLETATRHVLFNLVCCWTVPLSSILKPLREVFDIGCRTGDYEYASYAAHGYAHHALYAGRPLAPLLDEALALGHQMQALGEVNALHVHRPFEQLLEGLCGKLERPWCLSEGAFDEDAALAEADAAGSRSGAFVTLHVMGLARYMFGRPAEAAACFARARSYLDAAPSVWHVPILHQYSVLAACRQMEATNDPAERAELRAVAEGSLAALVRLTGVHAGNFAHRESLARAELLRIDGDRKGALELFARAVQQAHEGGFINDVALAHELSARCHDDPADAHRAGLAARDAYAQWGAVGKVQAFDAEP